MHSTIVAHWQTGVWVTGKDFDSGVIVLILKESSVQSAGLSACTITIVKYQPAGLCTCAVNTVHRQ
jgi:hypothetical protein